MCVCVCVCASCSSAFAFLGRDSGDLPCDVGLRAEPTYRG